MRLNIFFPIFSFFLAVSCSERQKPEDADALKTVVINYYDGIKDHDRDKMTGATTEDFLLYEQGKVWNNDSVFREMERYPYRVSFSFNKFHSIVDQSTGHLSYQVRADFVFDDSVKQRYDFIESAAFVKRDGVWKMTFLHVTKSEMPRYDTIRYATGYYARRMGEFSTESVKKASIIFLGNSIVEFGDWKKLLNDSSVVNRGVAGDNTFGVLDRLEDVIVRQPDKLFIEIGINDISQNIPVDVIVDNITTIIDRVHEGSSHTQVFFVSILPTNDKVKNEYPDAFNKNHITDLVNRQVLGMAGIKSFTFIDLNTALRDEHATLSEKYAEQDGLHLNEEGYKVWVKMLRDEGYL